MARYVGSVLLIGPMGVGKTTVAEILCNKYGYVKYALAEPVKRVAGEVFPWIEDKPKSVRRTYMQRTGKMLRRINPNPILYHATTALKNSAEPLVIDDGRTVEEAEWAVANGLSIVVLTCEDNERCQRLQKRDGSLPDLRTFQDRTETEWSLIEAPAVDTTHLTPEEVAREVMSLI